MPLALCPQVSSTGLTFDTGSGPRTLLFSSISGSTWNATRLGRLKDALQALLDTRIPITSLSTDDPARLSNPGLLPAYAGWWFWDGSDLVCRPVVVTEVVATGDANAPVRITVSQTHRNFRP